MINTANCCNCSACYHSCPQQVISLEINQDGFPVPVINPSGCTRCDICESVCPILHPNIDKYCEYESPNVYGAIHKSSETRKYSQSGGAFTAISDVILEEGGVVYRFRLNEKFEAIHDSQISGLRNYLRHTNTDKLVCVDLICHGVPSPKIWSEYLAFTLEKYHGAKIDLVNFRNKNKFGWHSHVETVTIDGKQYDSKVYTDLFYAHTFFAPSCFACPFRSTHVM